MKRLELKEIQWAHVSTGERHSTNNYGEISNTEKYQGHPPCHYTHNRHRGREPTLHGSRGQCCLTFNPSSLFQPPLSREARFPTELMTRPPLQRHTPKNQRLDQMHRNKTSHWTATQNVLTLPRLLFLHRRTK